MKNKLHSIKPNPVLNELSSKNMSLVIELEFLLLENAGPLQINDISILTFQDLMPSISNNFLTRVLMNYQEELLIHYFTTIQTRNIEALNLKIKAWLAIRNLDISMTKTQKNYQLRNGDYISKFVVYFLSANQKSECCLIIAVPISTLEKLSKNPPSNNQKY